MPLEIVGAGFGRTGTASMKRALEHLGYPCHHMMEMFPRMERVPHLEHAWAGRPVDWEALFEGFTAMVDFPGSQYWEPLMHAYPQAKVLLTSRDPESWYESAHATIYPKDGVVRDSPLHRYIRRAIWDGLFEGRFEDRSYTEQKFRDWNQRVIDTVPAERLIVCEVGAGWEPLCAGLGVPVPDEPWPRTNSREEFIARPPAELGHSD